MMELLPPPCPCSPLLVAVEGLPWCAGCGCAWDRTPKMVMNEVGAKRGERGGGHRRHWHVCLTPSSKKKRRPFLGGQRQSIAVPTMLPVYSLLLLPPRGSTHSLVSLIVRHLFLGCFSAKHSVIRDVPVQNGQSAGMFQCKMNVNRGSSGTNMSQSLRMFQCKTFSQWGCASTTVHVASSPMPRTMKARKSPCSWRFPPSVPPRR
jgi:hypothetical protein